jgi:uncharacterized protein YqgV (UPF0045/DUF77 family)
VTEEIGVSAQVSLYPLGQQDLALAIDALLAVLAERKLPHETGTMSTTVYGTQREVFDALADAYAAACAYGPAVLTITISNACPLPGGAVDG